MRIAGRCVFLGDARRLRRLRRSAIEEIWFSGLQVDPADRKIKHFIFISHLASLPNRKLNFFNLIFAGYLIFDLIFIYDSHSLICRSYSFYTSTRATFSKRWPLSKTFQAEKDPRSEWCVSDRDFEEVVFPRELSSARSRLCRRRCLRGNIQCWAFFESCKMCIRARRFKKKMHLND